MNANSYFLISAIAFALVAVIHIVRLVNGMAFTLGDMSVPAGVSVIGAIVAGTLSIWGFKLRR